MKLRPSTECTSQQKSPRPTKVQGLLMNCDCPVFILTGESMNCTTEERYLAATQTSNLKVEAEVKGAADVLIASGWSSSRIGHALMRLHSKPTRDNLEQVHTQVSIEADRLNIASPDAVAGAVIAWWLARVCPVCHGRKYDTIENTPSLSAIQCPRCHGSGEKRLPDVAGAHDLVLWMDYCKHAHVGQIKRRLRPGD